MFHIYRAVLISQPVDKHLRIYPKHVDHKNSSGTGVEWLWTWHYRWNKRPMRNNPIRPSRVILQLPTVHVNKIRCRHVTLNVCLLFFHQLPPENLRTVSQKKRAKMLRRRY